ncbi:MAG: TIGR03943 family putative permease subunit [Candidatus Nanopelagicales bacterium]
MNREVQAIVLILLGGSTLRISIGDTYLRYVKAGMRPYLLVSGAILLMLGVWAIVDIVRSHRREAAASPVHAHVGAQGSGYARGSIEGNGEAPSGVPGSFDELDAAHDDDDGHGHGSMRVAWLLLLPVLAILLVAPPALGAYSAQRGPSQVVQPTDIAAFDPLPPGNPADMALSDYAVRAIWDDQNTLAGRNVKLTGFVTPAPNGKWWLTRLSLTCCAADAVTTKVLAVGAPNLPANTWVSLTGTYVAGGGTQSDTAVPWIKTEALRRIDEPKNPYE